MLLTFSGFTLTNVETQFNKGLFLDKSHVLFWLKIPSSVTTNMDNGNLSKHCINIQWFHAYKCGYTVSNSGLWLKTPNSFSTAI